MQKIKDYISRSWPWIITTILVIIAIVFYFQKESNDAANLGSFLSGFSSAIAFIWLIASFKLQSKELSLQRQELELQRISLEKQVKELKNNSKFNTLTQIENILKRAENEIKESDLNIKSYTEIQTLFLKGMEYWNPILESKDFNKIIENYSNWIKIEGLAKSYLSNISLALKLYMEHYIEQPFELKENDEVFVSIYYCWMQKAPLLSKHAGSASMLAEIISFCEPSLKSFLVAWAYAGKKSLGKDLFKKGALKEMKEELIKKGYPVPEIAKD